MEHKFKIEVSSRAADYFNKEEDIECTNKITTKNNKKPQHLLQYSYQINNVTESLKQRNYSMLQ